MFSFSIVDYQNYLGPDRFLTGPDQFLLYGVNASIVSFSVILGWLKITEKEQGNKQRELSTMIDA